MVSKIYKIINDINDKVYIGKTSFTLEERFNQHLRDAQKRQYEQRPLYSAIRKYGKEHFKILLVEECDSKIENEREKYWIEYYHSYSKGYNATLGGEGSCLYNHDEIASLIREGKSTKEISSLIGCCKDIIYCVSKQYNLSLNFDNTVNVNSPKKVHQYSLSNEYIQSFDSYADAARWLQDNNYVKGNLNGVRSHIGEVCQGKRKTAYKFIWKNI